MIHKAGMVQPSAFRFLPTALLSRKDTINSSRLGDFNWNPLWVMRVKGAKYRKKPRASLPLSPLFLYLTRFPAFLARKNKSPLFLPALLVSLCASLLLCVLWIPIKKQDSLLTLHSVCVSLSLFLYPPPLIQSVAHTPSLLLHASPLQISVLGSTERRWALQRPYTELRFKL